MNQNDVCANGCVKDVCLRIVASTEILMGESCCGCWLLITPYEGLAIYHDWRVTMTVFLYLRRYFVYTGSSSRVFKYWTRKYFVRFAVS